MPSKRSLEAGKAHVALWLDDSALKRGLKGLQSRFQTLANTSKVYGTAFATAGAVIAAPYIYATRVLANYDDAIRATAAVSQADPAGFARLDKLARELGASTSYTAAEVANLMTELARAGFNVPQIEDMTGSVLALARATGTDAAISAGIMAATIRQYGLEAEDAARVSDLLTAAANSSFNTVEGLGESLKYAGPIAAQLNMSLEDTLAVLGALGNAGIQGSEAGTAVRRLSVITATEADSMAKIFGVSFRDMNGEALPLIDTMSRISESMQGDSAGTQAEKLNQVFGLLGITSSAVLSSSISSVEKLREVLANASGTAQRTASEMDAGIGGSLRILLSGIEGVTLAFADAFAPELQQVIKWLTTVAGSAREFATENKALILSVAGAAAGLATLAGGLAGFGMVSSGLASLLAIASALSGPLVAVGAALASVYAASQLLKENLPAL
ncbi:MAG: phage tail tape measure protein, partial [Planctomycetaceae bacterium]|nr:phage tail tape measure protein [Planctomycetaceae bacterium]